MATSNDLPPPSVPSHSYQQQYQQYQQAPSQFPPLRETPSQPPVSQRPAAQTRKSRSISFRSDKSHGSNHKIDLHETSAEKEAKRLHSKADPTLAMNEAEPAEVAAQVKSSLAPLRSIQHKDAFGNPIADPDRSNPTRSRWERPLDTIRSFEAAIDGGYTSRRSMLRSDAESVSWGNNRRSSYYASMSSRVTSAARPVTDILTLDGNNARFSHDSYYGGRPPSMMYPGRPDGAGSQHDLRSGGMGPPRDSYYDQQGSHTPGPQNQGRRGYPRMMSEPPPFSGPYRQQNPNDYVLPPNHRSYETVASAASGSGTSGEPSGYQTDPTSSDNSSVERVQVPPKPPQPLNDYGIGFSQNSAYQAPQFTVGLQNNPQSPGGQNGYHPVGAPPPVPQKAPTTILRKPTAIQQVQERPAMPEKRKSWLARRFSKSS
ncbi:meiotically up-regulated gene 9 protein [Echria macrotheca]|uniref:Meiotically up-regulated gene 9 protein n=1 Tax=Echria macrotheca TaxID=438768 RepID=A0AAJ0F8Q6_9PEZI|nr:meiotically up-regulated gene 9 protein [Echria macrotheca]